MPLAMTLSQSTAALGIILLLSPATGESFTINHLPTAVKESTLSRVPPSNRNLRIIGLPKPVRGGSIFRGSREEQADFEKAKLKRKQQGITAALFSTFVALMGAKCALPTTLAMLNEKETGLTFLATTGMASSTPQEMTARVLATSTMAIAFGKFLLGPVIDRYGGIFSLKVAHSLLGIMLATISLSQSFEVFAVCWVAVDFVFSSCWAGALNAIHQSFPKEEWGDRVSMLAVASRIGNASAFSIFSLLLQWAQRPSATIGNRQPWRVVFGFSAIVQLIPLSLLAYFGSSSIETATEVKEESPPSLVDSLATLQKEARTPEFWCHLVSRSAMMVFASFLLFVPSYMSCAYGMTHAVSARMGSVYAIGCLLALTTLTKPFTNYGKRGKSAMLAIMLGAATLTSLAQVAHLSGMMHFSKLAGALFMLVWGLSFAIPFYMPPSLFALKRGGRESSATIADVFDFFGFTLLALFNGHAAGIKYDSMSAWIRPFWLLTTCAVTSLVSLLLAVNLE